MKKNAKNEKNGKNEKLLSAYKASICKALFALSNGNTKAAQSELAAALAKMVD